MEVLPQSAGAGFCGAVPPTPQYQYTDNANESNSFMLAAQPGFQLPLCPGQSPQPGSPSPLPSPSPSVPLPAPSPSPAPVEAGGSSSSSTGAIVGGVVGGIVVVAGMASSGGHLVHGTFGPCPGLQLRKGSGLLRLAQASSTIHSGLGMCRGSAPAVHAS